MRYTVIYFHNLEMRVLGEISTALLRACRKGLVAIVDMETQRELDRNGQWVALAE